MGKMKYGSLHNAKIYWSTKEVVGLTGVPAYTLRYWERVVPYLQVARNRAKNRAWQKKEIDFVIALKSLLENKDQAIPVAEAGEKIAGEIFDPLEYRTAGILAMPPEEEEGIGKKHTSPATPVAENSQETQNTDSTQDSQGERPELPGVVPPDSQMDLFSDVLSAEEPLEEPITPKKAAAGEPPSQTLPFPKPQEPPSTDSSSPVRRAQPTPRHPDPAVLRNLRAELLDAIARLKTSPEKP